MVRITGKDVIRDEGTTTVVGLHHQEIFHEFFKNDRIPVYESGHHHGHIFRIQLELFRGIEQCIRQVLGYFVGEPIGYQ